MSAATKVILYKLRDFRLVWQFREHEFLVLFRTLLVLVNNMSKVDVSKHIVLFHESSIF